jgi:hypothetical protein
MKVVKIFAVLLFVSSLLHAQTRGINDNQTSGNATYPSPAQSTSRTHFYSQSDFVNDSFSDHSVKKPSKEWFPTESIFPKFLADGTAQGFSLNKNAYTKRWVGGIGGLLRFYQINYDNLKIQIGLGATVYASLIRRPDVLDVQTAGFFVDFPVEFRFSETFAVRTGYGHYSAHLVDDGIEALKLHSINYAKDYFPVYAAYRFDERGSWIYGGFRFDTYTIPEYHKRWNIQAGIEGGNYKIVSGIKLYGAVDIKFKSEVAWATTQSYQVGLKLLEKGARAIRLAYTYRTGIEDRGQFYKNRVKLSLMGVYFDF